jgi:hypothetical protein
MAFMMISFSLSSSARIASSMFISMAQSRRWRKRRGTTLRLVSLSGFVSQDVTRITGGAQNPKAYSLGFYDFPVAVINK